MRKVEVYTLPEADVPLTEEMIAVTMAKCSRSPESFRDIARKLKEDDASKFNEKYVIGYGHASVAEGAIPTLCLENVSILASKVLESLPRPSVQEKSTRYQEFNEDAVYSPFNGATTIWHFNRFNEAIGLLFDLYRYLTPKLMEHAESQIPKDVKNRQGAVKGRAFDAARYCLPAGTQTNLAMRINALDAARLISKMKVHPSYEIKQLALKIQEVLVGELPTLVRHVEEARYTKNIDAVVGSFTHDVGRPKYDGLGQAGVHMSAWDTKALENVLAAFIYTRAEFSLEGAKSLVLTWPLEKRVAMLEELMSTRGVYDAFPEEFSASSGYIFDVQMDYGAYRDLQRHRRLYQNSQPLSVLYGFTIPDDVYEINEAQRFHEAMEKVRDIVTEGQVSYRTEMQYAIPLAFLHRTTYYMDLRELAYIIELRSKPQGHISYRRIVNAMWVELERVQPFIVKHIKNIPATSIGAHS